MNTCHQASTLTSSDACLTPTEGSNALPRKTGWSSSTVEIDRSSKRPSSVENSGQCFKRHKTPSSCPATNNEHIFTSGRRPSATESERDEEEGMNANDVVNQRGNVVGVGDDSPSALDVKVKNFICFSLLFLNKEKIEKNEIMTIRTMLDFHTAPYFAIHTVLALDEEKKLCKQ